MRKLHIFYAAQQGCISIPGSMLWDANLYQPLVDLGHNVTRLKYDLLPHYHHLDPGRPEAQKFISKNRPLLEKALLDQIEKEHEKNPIDLFFSYFYSACVRPETIKKIRGMGICTINWYCNASYQFHLVKEIAPYYDFCLVPEKYRLNDYLKAGARPIYCQEAANPNIYHPYNLPYIYDVTFAGAKYGNRMEYVQHIYNQGINIKVWGPNWILQKRSVSGKTAKGLDVIKKLSPKNIVKKIINRLLNPSKTFEKVPNALPDEVTGPVLSDEELIKLYSQSKINLGFSTVGSTHLEEYPIKQLRLRDFEAPMSGAFYMIEYMPELEEFFDIGKEIVCYHNKYDLTEKIKYFLTHDNEREKIRQACYKRCLLDHTWHKRFEMVFKQAGLT